MSKGATGKQDMAAYMRRYRAEGRDRRRAPPQRVDNADRVNVINHRVTASAFDVGHRRELRKGSGVLMWPNRALGRDPSVNLAEVEAALRRIKIK